GGAAQAVLGLAIAIEQDLLHGFTPSRAFVGAQRSARKLPAEPVAERAPHDQLLVLRRQPGQLFGEHRDALFPRARHPRDVRPPEHAVRAERVVELADVAVNVAIRVWLGRIAGRSGRLQRDGLLWGGRPARTRSKPPTPRGAGLVT